MPDPNIAQTLVDPVLTNLTVSWFETQTAYVLHRAFPVVPVTMQGGVYFKYNQGDFLRDEARLRSHIAQSAGSDYRLTTEPYFVQKYAFHKDVSPEERVNYPSPIDANRDATRFVAQKIAIRREMLSASVYMNPASWTDIITGVAATPGANQTLQWNLETSNPIADIRNAKLRIVQRTGRQPNTLILSPVVYNALIDNFDIIDRIKYSQIGVVGEDLLASLLGVSRVIVTWGVVNNASVNEADNFEFMVGNHALLVYTADNPSIQEPSAGYMLSWTGLMGANANTGRIYRLPMDLLGLGVERVEGEFAAVPVVVAPDMGVFFQNIAV